MNKKCINCKVSFTEKKVLSDCANCKTCLNTCDDCQLVINLTQQDIKERLEKNPSNFSIPIEAKFVGVWVSKDYPYLIKEVFEGVNTGKNIETYYYWKVVEGEKIFYCPKNNIERDKQIEATTKWIDFSNNDKSSFLDLRYLEKRIKKCSVCNKIKQIISNIPLSDSIVCIREKNTNKMIKSTTSCSECLTKIIKHVEKDRRKEVLQEFQWGRRILVALKEAKNTLEQK
jgi:hypothetical protein